jgi:two-component system cell cycle sensor histidine kinase/response regulator CckA
VRESLRKPKFPWWLIAIIVLVAASTLWASIGLAVSESRQQRLSVDRDLLRIGQLKAEQIASWRATSLGDANLVANTPFAVDVVRRWLASGDAADQAELLAWFAALQEQHRYVSVQLVDPNGSSLLALGKSKSLRSEPLKTLRTAFAQQTPLLTDLHWAAEGDYVYLDAVAPLFDSESGGDQPLAAVVLTSDANDFLFPLIQAWPTASASAETILVERRNDQVVFLNDLRFRQGTALTLEFPLSQTDLPAVMAVLGRQGIATGRDYRDVEVLSALQAVPDSPWFIVAKIDSTEALAGARARLILIVTVVAVLLLAMIVTTALVWQRTLKRRYQRAYDVEISRKLLAERYEHLVQQANDIILLSDQDGRVVEANERAVEAYGYSREELLGLQSSDLIPSGELPAFAERTRMAREAGSYVAEASHRRKDGSVFPVEVSARTVLSEGKPYAQAIVRDLTERRRGEATRRLMQYSIDNALDSVLWTDAEGRLLYASESACRQYGYSREELLQQTIFDIDPTVTREIWATNWQKLKKGEPHGVESFHHTKTGDTFPVEVHDSYVNLDGMECVCVFARDITNRREAQKALIERDEQLRQSQKMEAVGQLAGGIAHDFNNLLTAILGYGDLLLAGDELAGPSAREDMEQIKRAAERAAGLTRQILTFSRRQTMRPQVVSLNEVLANVEPLLRRTLGENIELVSVPDPDLGDVEVDVHQLEQVLMNLALNARDAMPSGGRLTLETANVELDSMYCHTHPEVIPGQYAVLAVSDTGLGMENDTLSHIFEPFFTTKGPGEGSGLGLATVYGTVSQSHGSITVYSEPAKGTCFKIYLPVTTTPAQSQPEVTEEPATPTGDETILLVEDEPALLDLAVRVLTDYGYKVLSAGTAAEALQVLRDADGKMDILVTDLVLPGEMQGKELADHLRSSRPDLLVVYMSGYPRNSIVHAGRLDHGVSFLEKPFATSALAAMIRESLDRAPGRT